MKPSFSLSSRVLLGVFSATLLSFLAFGLASPVFPQGVGPTPSTTPFSNWGPDLSRLDASYETKAFIQRARGLYYSYPQQGLKRFRCRIDDDGWNTVLLLLALQGFEQKIKEKTDTTNGTVESLKKMGSLEFFLDYSPEKGFVFEREGIEPTGNPTYDKLMDQMSLFVKTEVLCFAKAWEGMVGMGKSPKEKSAFQLSKTDRGYDLTETSGDDTSVLSFREDGLLTEARIPILLEKGKHHLQGKDILLKFSFRKLKGGYLPETITFQDLEGEFSGRAHVDYEELGTVQMPQRVDWHLDIKQKEPDKDNSQLGDSLGFYHYQINGEEVNSPLPKPRGIDMLYVLQRAFDEGVHSGMEFHVAFGPFLSNSPRMSSQYSGYVGTFGIGYEFTRAFSLSVEIGGGDYSSKTGGNNLNLLQILLLGKYRLTTGDLRPYLIGGVGIGDSFSFPPSSPITNGVDEIDLAAECGGGLELRLNGDFFLMAQTGLVYQGLSPSFARNVPADSPVNFVPLHLGVSFER